MSAGRLRVSSDPGVTEPRVEGVRAKLTTDPRAVAAASGTAMSVVDGHLRIDVPEPPGRGRLPQVLVDVTVPAGASVTAQVGEAEVVCTGRVGDVYARTTSGSVHLERVDGTLDVRTGRGPVTVHVCHGPTDIAVADAGVIIRACEGPLRVIGRSGDVAVWRLSASADLRTTTGNVRIGWVQGRPVRLDVQAGTGLVDVAVRDDPRAADVLSIHTISGDVRLSRASA